jgi:hypothetical protein
VVEFYHKVHKEFTEDTKKKRAFIAVEQYTPTNKGIRAQNGKQIGATKGASSGHATGIPLEKRSDKKKEKIGK